MKDEIIKKLRDALEDVCAIYERYNFLPLEGYSKEEYNKMFEIEEEGNIHHRMHKIADKTLIEIVSKYEK